MTNGEGLNNRFVRLSTISRQRAKIRWLSEKNEKFSRRYETPHTICRDHLLDIIRHDCQNSPRNIHRLISGTKMITTTSFLLTVYVDPRPDLTNFQGNFSNVTNLSQFWNHFPRNSFNNFKRKRNKIIKIFFVFTRFPSHRKIKSEKLRGKFVLQRKIIK